MCWKSIVGSTNFLQLTTVILTLNTNRIYFILSSYPLFLRKCYFDNEILLFLSGQLAIPNIINIFWEKNVDYVAVIFVYFLPRCIIHVTEYIYYEMVSLIKYRFKMLNNILQTINDSESNNIFSLEGKNKKTFHLLCDICTCHHNLVKSITLTNKTFGFRMVSHFIFSFVCLSIHVFLICRGFKKDIYFGYLIEYSTMVLCYAISVYRICKRCEYSVQEVSMNKCLYWLSWNFRFR